MKSLLSLNRISFVASLLATGFCLRAEVPLITSTNHSANLPLKQISPGIFQLGSVRFDKEQKTLWFPAMINMTNGLIEYFVVTGTGKLHESLLKTETEPSQIHLAMLLIGAKGAATNSISTDISGDKITIEVSWKNGDADKRVRAEELIFNSEAKSSMSKGAWIYNGSKVIGGTFIAQRDGSIVSIIGDPLALANSSQPARDNDEIWSVNTNAISALNILVEVTFKLVGPQTSTQ